MELKATRASAIGNLENFVENNLTIDVKLVGQVYNKVALAVLSVDVTLTDSVTSLLELLLIIGIIYFFLVFLK